MTIKERIAEILPKKYDDPRNATSHTDEMLKWTRNDVIEECRKALEQAVSEGKLCLDPPTRGEIQTIIIKWFSNTAYMDVRAKEQSELIDLISSRIRNGREE